MRYSKKTKKSIALTLMFVLSSQILLPNAAMALTTGPTQPEVQSFEPVGTTDMVDMFSGDFVYNIPLMDVEGYPVNISYHGGVNMEQEASWVGLGWNINPGVINRGVRGLPDDFNGDTLSKELHIKDDKTLRVGIGVGAEFAGVGDPFMSLSASLGGNLTFNNYRGTSCDINLGAGINLFQSVSLGVNMGVGSQTGAEIDYNASISAPSALAVSKNLSLGVGYGVSQGYSTRTGLTDRCLSYSATLNTSAGSTSQTTSNNIPIGVKNFVPVITNSSTMRSYSGRIKFGGELAWCLGYVTANGMYSQVHYNNDGSKDAYGYMYLQNASTVNHYSILDFTRDKDGQFNKTMQYLPPANLTYDIYNVSGQGTGGVFRPYRNDFGSVYDPVTKSEQTSDAVGLEAGAGWIFEVGGDYTDSKTELKSGPWAPYLRNYVKRTQGSLYEDVYLKQGGELTRVNPQYFTDISGLKPVTPEAAVSIPATKAGATARRDARGNLVYYYTASEMTQAGVGFNPKIYSYTSTNGFADGANATKTEISRIGTNRLQHKSAELGEIVQLQTDGRKYVYGIPAMNHVQREATFSVAPPSGTDRTKGLVPYSPTDASTSNSKGIDNYYSSTTTPSYAHSYLLTSVLSSDYVDVTGNGVSDDDLGSYTKMNYTRKESDYRWKAPFDAAKAQYDPGFLSDPKDDKGSIVVGSREQWYLHSIETRNFVAEFYTSQRNDACGVTDAVVSSGQYALPPYNTATTAAKSYKLDSIKLYNKHDRFINQASAVPVKTVYFVYTDTLCKGIPNVLTGSGTAGKLTLNKIYFKYGNSERSMISPYEFAYGYNPDYNISCKDRWGTYKPEPVGISNFEFPFVDQRDALNDTYASAWSLTKISLPSGGIIQTQYESDDYAFVQDKPVNEMFMVKGIGNGPAFNPSTQLYANEASPYLYLYFLRRHGMERVGSMWDNYLPNQNIIYYNFNLKLNDANNNSFEQIKGYAEITEVGECPGAGNYYGYVKLKPIEPAGSEDDELNLNPITFTAINYGRYSLSHVLYPGTASEPDGGFEMLEGLKAAFEELISIYKNPVVQMIKKKHNARTVDLKKSFIRLQSPGLCKKGGGQRVKALSFFDNWNALAGGNEQSATYGKQYEYNVKDSKYGVISSGVASYEPMVGGDENPFRQPVPYIVQSGSNFPPSDPIDLYQEMPIGESLFPPASVGYSRIVVKSIHSSVGVSSQGVDVHQFYTARDFPARVTASAINSSFKHKFTFFKQENEMTGTQGYSLVFNDMHGKPKSTQHFIHHPGSTDQLVSYQTYNYHMEDGLLDNNVNCLVYDTVEKKMVVRKLQLGLEADMTFDSRLKEEHTKTSTLNCNFNLSGVFIFIFPIALAFKWTGKYNNDFQSATVTKVVQQYGILDNVQSFNEGAVTVVRNELFDPETGQVVVTSVNNEYHDKEYTTNLPAWWSYIGMAPAYGNIKYEKDVASVDIQTNLLGRFSGAEHFAVGDELIMSFKDASGVMRETKAWIMAATKLELPDCKGCCFGFVLPHFPTATAGWTPSTTLTNVHFKVVNSGAKNMLSETMETYAVKGSPLIPLTGGGEYLSPSNNAVISNSARVFCDSNTRTIPRYFANPDTINPYATGERGIYRLLSEYAYVKDRSYASGAARDAGLYQAINYFSATGVDPDACVQFPYNYLKPGSSTNWYRARTITKWSPYGQEVENLDAVGNYSSAVFGYNQDLPVAVASNAKQGEVLAESFEDYALLNHSKNIMRSDYSPFTRYFDSISLPAVSPVYNRFKLDNLGADLEIVAATAHTGKYALSVPVASAGMTNVYSMDIPLNNYDYSTVTTRYNTYFPVVSYTLTPANEFLPFKLNSNKNYILSFWVKKSGSPSNITTYSLPDSCGIRVGGTVYKPNKKTNIIDGWQQVEVPFKVTAGAVSVKFRMPKDYYIDDVRFFPSDGNIKSFVYNPVNEKLMATLDENNFATFYEYDQEGNLVRTKKETERGIMTISESRSNNPKK